MPSSPTQRLVEELEKEASTFEGRAKFWESPEVLGAATLQGNTLQPVGKEEIAQRYRQLAAEWRSLIERIRHS